MSPQRLEALHDCGEVGLLAACVFKRGGDLAYRTTPATIMAWAAKAMDAEVDGRVIVEHAVSMAIRVRRFQGNCVLGLDAFDEDVAAIWKGRYGFWNAAPPLEPAAEPPRRLWISLDAFSR